MTPMKPRLLWLLAGWLLAVYVRGDDSGGEKSVYRLGVFRDNAPFSFVEREGGRPEGFVNDLMAEVEALMGLRFERRVGSTAEILAAFAAGEVDVLQSFARFPEREARVDFSVPYLVMAGAIFVREGDDRVKSLEDLRGLRVLVHAGSLGEAVLRRAGLEESIVVVASVEDALRRLAAGEGDATLAARLSGLSSAHQMGLRTLRVVEAELAGYEVRYCMAVQKGNGALLARLNEGLATLVRTGRYEEIYQRWFGHVAASGYSREQVVLAVAAGLALALVVAIVAVWRLRRLAREIRRQAEALRASEQRHRGLFEGAREGLVVLERGAEGWRVETANPAARRLLGEEVGAVATGAGLGDDLLRVLGEAADAGREEEFEQEWGGGRWLRVGLGKLGEKRLVTLLDITESVEARERMRRQEEHLRQKQKLEAIGTLAGGVAHDFNNLLTVIMGNLELAQLQSMRGGEVGAHLATAQLTAKRAGNLVRQILAFSRRTPSRRETLRVEPVVEETVQMLRALGRQEVEYSVELPIGLPVISADPAQLQQALMNLGTNAIQAMRGRRGRLRIRAEVVTWDGGLPAEPLLPKAGRYVCLEVGDDGPGMTAEVKAQAFEPFFTTKAPGEGSGLGLAVVHGVMERHEGVVALETAPGEGCRFRLYFPAADRAASAAPFKDAGVCLGRGQMIMLVDDDPLVATTAGALLEVLGYRVRCWTNPVAAWAEYQREPGAFAVLVSDLSMPEMTGMDLLERVRGVSAKQPFVLCSGYFSEAEQELAERLGVSVLLPKPLDRDKLAQALSAALGASGSG